MTTHTPPHPATLTASLHEALAAGLAPCAEQVDDALHEQAVDRVSEMYRLIVRESADIEPLYRPAGEWRVYIDERRGLYDAILAGERTKASDLLRGFWRNELGTIVKEYAKYEELLASAQPRTDRFLEFVPRNYKIWRDIVGGDPSVLGIPPVGDPWGLMIDGRLVAPKATRFHALAWQITELTRGSPDRRVVEIGAGYAGMAYYMLRDNPAVRYIDLDLPETLVLAAYSLICCLPGRDIVLHGERDAEPADIQADALLLPNYELPNLPDAWADVTVNTFSLSEMTRPVLEENLRQITRFTRGCFLHHNMDRPGVINRGTERVPASTFPIDPAAFRLLHKGFDLFHGRDGDYREFLYERIG